MANQRPDSGYRLDEIDRRIIYALMADARNTSAPMIAEEVSVSPATIRNRIDQLESHGIIRGYHTSVDFESAEGGLTTLFQCNVPVENRESIAQKVSAIPGVINVRKLMTGRRNLHVVAVGADTKSLERIGRALSELGAEIEDEDLVQDELSRPYAPYGPDETTAEPTPMDVISLTGDANVVEVTVGSESEIRGYTLEEAGNNGVLPDDLLVVAIERDGTVLTPRGETTIRSDDVVTVLSRDGIDDRTLDSFQKPATEFGREPDPIDP
ncbi:Lrp/AsnC family transcriptional regulator [Halostagnicola sp. A-GB9-2]|uniref:Lrp/AsnC family transcriptional regulator n=1 Tax=Halostagnicola sp. A-GB9-2 TaxID=3048066 RepID=UPI0024BF3DBF|nr:Lrp/AsnC family transcriptional regulator [Halostagnicola sp. A-GB9-2]MDJ1431282.1 TrkA C-terminal domain-containing protein [Halostagnicola sp. A-GB9-2]